MADNRMGLWRVQFCDEGHLEEPESDDKVRFNVAGETVQDAIHKAERMYRKAVEHGSFGEGRVIVAVVLIGMESD